MYLVPSVQESIDCLVDEKILSTLEPNSGYWQVEVSDLFVTKPPSCLIMSLPVPVILVGHKGASSTVLTSDRRLLVEI